MKNALFAASSVFALGLAMVAGVPAHAAEAPAAAVQKSMQQKVVLNPGPSTGRSASDVVRDFYGTLVNVMKDGSNLQFQGRYEKLRPAVARAFNAQDMMRMASGPSWVKVAPGQQSRLVNAFIDFSAANYASQFKSYDGEKFEVVGEKKGSNANEVIVETRLSSGSETHDLNYLMRKGNGGWKIVDVYVNGTISEMATRRSEFGSVLRTNGPDALFDLLSQRSRAMGEG